jgi:hypothetical protein
MKDRLWRAVYDELLPLLTDRDVIAAPKGDWPAFRGTTILYDDQIELKGCTVLILHKGLLTGLPKAELRGIAEEWQWVFANEVFLVFDRLCRIRRDLSCTASAIHWGPLIRYLSSSSLRRRRSKIIYVHVPKTGGTSMWASLTKAFPSHVYYPTCRAYLNNPPAPDEYDLIGLHFSPSVLLPSLRRDDWVIGMVREPAQRVLSAVMHSRRVTADVKTFTPAARAMRDMEFAKYLATDFGGVEARLQLITFGTEYGETTDALSDDDLLCTARAFVQRDNVILAPSELSAAFVRFVSRRLGFRPGALRRLNVNRRWHSAIDPDEIGNAVCLLDAINAREREFYDFVCRSFDELRSNWAPPRRLIASLQRVRRATITPQAARAGQTGSL